MTFTFDYHISGCSFALQIPLVVFFEKCRDRMQYAVFQAKKSLLGRSYDSEWVSSALAP